MLYTRNTFARPESPPVVPYEVKVSLLRREVQRRPPVLGAAVDERVLGYQQLAHGQGAVLGGKVEGALAWKGNRKHNSSKTFFATRQTK